MPVATSFGSNTGTGTWLLKSNPFPPVSCFAILALVYFTFLFPSPEYNSYNINDASYFLTLATNLVQYNRYTTDICPDVNYGRHVTWPPAFPFLLAIVVYLTNHSWMAIKFLMALMGICNLLLLRNLFKNNSEGQWAVILTGLCPAYFLFSHTTMTEVPFMLACTTTLVFAQRARAVKGCFIAGLLAALAFLTRGYAVVFVPAGLLYFFTRKSVPLRKRYLQAFAFLAPLVLIMILWAKYTTEIIDSGHLDEISTEFSNGSGILRAALRSPLTYVKEFYTWHGRYPAHLLIPIVSRSTALRSDSLVLVSAVLLLMAAIGYVLSVRRELTFYDLWLGFGILLILISKNTNARYWLTYVPGLFYYILTTSAAAGIWTGIRWLRSSVLLVLLAASVVGLSFHLSHPDQLRFLDSYWREYRDAFLWVREHTPRDAIVVVGHGTPQAFVASERCIKTLSQTNSRSLVPQQQQTGYYFVSPKPGFVRESSHVPASLSQRCADYLSSTEHIDIWSGNMVTIYQILGPRSP